MIKNKYLFFLILFFHLSLSYILPQTFREFHPIAINSHININKPYPFNLGKLSLLLWFSNDNKPITIINSCRHLGNNLKDSSFNNNKTCLICPFHNSIYNSNDNFGTTIIKNGIVWWSYKSYDKNPPYIKSNINYINKNIDINIDFISFIINFFTIYFNDFNNNINYKSYTNIKKKRFLIKDFNNNKRILFIYPYTFFISDFKKSTYMISLNPINDSKTKVYITINNEIESYINNYLFITLKIYLEKCNNNFIYKNKFIFRIYNSYIDTILNFYSNYSPINDFTINNFIINYKYY